MAVWETLIDYTVPSNTSSITFNNFGTITKNDFIRVVASIRNSSNLNIQTGLYANNQINANQWRRNSTTIFGTSTAATIATQNVFFQCAANQHSFHNNYLKLTETDHIVHFIDKTFNNNDIRLFATTQTSLDQYTNGISTLNISGNSIGSGSRIQVYKLNAVKVADITVTSNTTRLDITGLDFNLNDEYLLLSDNSTTNSFTEYEVFVNNDTTRTNYKFLRWESTGSGLVTAWNQNPPFNYGEKSFSYTFLHLSNGSRFHYESQNIRKIGETSPFFYQIMGSGKLAHSSITELNIISQNRSNGIEVGNRFQLYKMT